MTVDQLRRRLAAAIRAGDLTAQRAIRAELDQAAGPTADKETR